jgi:hypothetical protein
MERDFKDMLVALSDEKAEYLLVGAHAMAIHGCPRATHVIDFWVRPSPENAKRVLRALAIYGAPLQSVIAQDFENPETIFQIGMPPLRIDVITSIDGSRSMKRGRIVSKSRWTVLRPLSSAAMSSSACRAS